MPATVAWIELGWTLFTIGAALLCWRYARRSRRRYRWFLRQPRYGPDHATTVLAYGRVIRDAGRVVVQVLFVALGVRSMMLPQLPGWNWDTVFFTVVFVFAEAAMVFNSWHEERYDRAVRGDEHGGHD